MLLEEEPTFIRRRDLRKNKYEQEKLQMGMPHKLAKRTKPMGTHGVNNLMQDGFDDKGKQYNQTGKKYAGPNYMQKSTTGPLQSNPLK